MFPFIKHLNDVRFAITDDFYIAEKDWGYVINYHINAFPEIKENMTDDELVLHRTGREFRGLKFDIQGNIISRPWPKFFNWGEKENESKLVNFNDPFTIQEKLDGSMIDVYQLNGNVVLGTKMGETDIASQAQEFFNQHIDYVKFAEHAIADRKTLLFEWCSRKNRIVVDHPVDQLILTGVRDLHTGRLMTDREIRQYAFQFNIPVVKSWPGTFKGITEFLEEIVDEEQCEGYVLAFDSGMRWKIKNSWYLNLHRAKSKLDSEKNVYILVLNQDHDDLLPQLDDQARDGLEKFATKLANAIKFEAGFYDIAVKSAWAHYGNRKDFALNFASKAPWPAVAFKILDGKDDYDAVVDFALAYCATQAKLDTIKPRLGNLNWRDYYYPVDMCDD